jgi:oligopeptide/dipeptide ABC transporter ATP-binding protein
MGTRAHETEPLLDVRSLHVGFPTRDGVVLAANNVSFSVRRGEVLGLIGESGSGKSVTCRSLIGRVPKPGGVLGGEVWFRGRDLVSLSDRELRAVRAREIGFIFQDPTSFLNPLYTVGSQLSEVLRVNLDMPRADAPRHGIELLARVGIPSPEQRYHAYPHELSGGMRQRVMIAIAVAARPALLLADEPTTALDVTVQAQILALLSSLQSETGMAMILVSHDVGVVAQHSDSIAVMYAGYIVEQGPAEQILRAPRHPYTAALLDSLLPLRPRSQGALLAAIAGQPPELAHLPPGCPFGPRCRHAEEACAGVDMTLAEVGRAHTSACPIVRRSADLSPRELPADDPFEVTP